MSLSEFNKQQQHNLLIKKYILIKLNTLMNLSISYLALFATAGVLMPPIDVEAIRNREKLMRSLRNYKL